MDELREASRIGRISTIDWTGTILAAILVADENGWDHLDTILVAFFLGEVAHAVMGLSSPTRDLIETLFGPTRMQ